MNYYQYFAATSTYDCSAYGAGNYGEDCATATTTAQTTDSGTALADTGMPAVAFAIGGVLLIAIGAALLFKMLKTKKSKKS